ncbi:MAG TPA: prepilin-type N-terminal cleavage/methylation domain-containing protein [Gemmatimonadales bacterium]|nr:prepilin-type N-terminal cleavage/methylation domain-containing protein [Gemmatimonadales bacterium]
MKRNEGGFSLIEILVAMTLLGLCLVGVAQVTFVMARRAYANSGGQARGAILSQQINRFAALPFDSLRGKAGTDTVYSPSMPYVRTVTVESLSPTLVRVTIIVTPTNAVFKPDTLTLQRSKARPNPFGTS